MPVARKGTQFRGVTQGFSTAWWEDTPSNRKGMVVVRSLEDEWSKPLFTYEELYLFYLIMILSGTTSRRLATCGRFRKPK